MFFSKPYKSFTLSTEIFQKKGRNTHKATLTNDPHDTTSLP